MKCYCKLKSKQTKSTQYINKNKNSKWPPFSNMAFMSYNKSNEIYKLFLFNINVRNVTACKLKI